MLEKTPESLLDSKEIKSVNLEENQSSILIGGTDTQADVKVKVSVVSDSLRPHGLYIPGILQARILEWVALPFSRGSLQPKDQIQVSCIADRFFTSWATRETQYLGHLMWADDSLEKSLMLGKIVGRRRGHQRMRWMDPCCHLRELGKTSGDGERQGGLVCCSPWGRKEADSTGQLSNHFKNNTTTKFDNLDETGKFLERCLL